MHRIIYTLPNCPNCEALKAEWRAAGTIYRELPLEDLMHDGEALSSYRLDHNGCNPMAAPVVRDGEEWL